MQILRGCFIGLVCTALFMGSTWAEEEGADALDLPPEMVGASGAAAGEAEELRDPLVETALAMAEEPMLNPDSSDAEAADEATDETADEVADASPDQAVVEASGERDVTQARPTEPRAAARVKVVPVRGPIMEPVLFVVRRGIKEAQAEGMNAVLIDMDTPGGALGVTLEIMEALDRFEGDTMVYVNKEAISAGAIISAIVDEIYFAPGGVIGAAEVVMGGGADVGDGMKRKVNSFLNAKVRAYSEGKPFRAAVIKAMMDSDNEFELDGVVIKSKGELLTLTAEEAARTYGDPPQALLSAGTYDTIEALLDAKYGENNYTVSRLEVTWSEELAVWLGKIAPLLMGLGLLCVFVEFKTPGFGVFGVAGGLMLALVFFGHYTAGLSGQEAAIVFAVGVVLVAVELFLIPGTLVAGLTGAVLMLGALVWSMIDVWPGELPSFDADTLFTPLLNLGIALVVAVVGALALGRFLPRGWFLDRLVLGASISGDAATPIGGMGSDARYESSAPEGGDGLLGATGRTVSVLRPMGEIEIAGRRHEARSATGSMERGALVRVTGRSGRTLIVEPEDL